MNLNQIFLSHTLHLCSVNKLQAIMISKDRKSFVESKENLF